MNLIPTYVRSAFIAGICIGIAGFCFQAVGGIPGAVIFAFGLLSVVHYSLKLFTGTAGFFVRGEFGKLCAILGMNILGCLFVAAISHLSPLAIQEGSQKLVEGRLSTGPLQCGALAILCGFIMTTAVKWGREGKYLPIIYGVPVFILCGFPHSIADAFYFLSVPVDFFLANAADIIITYICIVIGNFIGCNIYRTILKTNEVV